MTTCAALAATLLLIFTGLVLHRRLARYLYGKNFSELPAEPDLLMLGILPGIALIGAAATYLAFFNFFNIGIFSVAMGTAIWCCRRDAVITSLGIGGLAVGFFKAAKGGAILPSLALLLFIVFIGLILLLAQLPTQNGDVWYFHIPLSQSIVEHAGLVYPEIPQLTFYSSQPLFIEMLHAIAFLAISHFVAADMINVSILFGLLFLLLSFANRARSFHFILILCVVGYATTYFQAAAEPVTDLPRSCFSVGAYLFAYRYAKSFQRYDLFMSALLAGAAVASKYTELITPALICLVLLPLMVSRRQTWAHLIPAIAVFMVVGSFWYLKNWVIYSNPIYPFLFAHPGLSDQWVVEYMKDLHRPFSVAARGYVTNLFTMRGWHDFAIVLHDYFLANSHTAYILDALFVIGPALPGRRRWMLPLLSCTLFVVWYCLMFNSARWAISAHLLFCSTAFIAWLHVFDPSMDVLPSLREARRTGDGIGQPIASPLIGYLRVGLGAGVALIFLWGAYATARGTAQGLPQGINRDLLRAAFGTGGLDKYQSETKVGYAMYRYIADHDLHNVLQPFDNGAVLFVSAYNGGKPNHWLLPYMALPESAAGTPSFVRREGVHYFIEPDDVRPEYDVYGKEHVDLAMAVMNQMRVGSSLIFKDAFGWSLYKVK